MEELREQLETLIDKAESTRGYSLWIDAPENVTDAIQSALDDLYLAAGLVEKELERKKQGEYAMKELYAMLDKYQAARDAIKGTSERLDKVQEVCAKCNAGLDQFFADAEAIDAAVQEAEGAAPNGELGDVGETPQTEGSI